MNPNSFALIQVMKKNGKIFVYFKCKIHNEGLPGENCCFLAFFKTGSKFVPNFKFLWPALHNFSQTNKKNTPGVWLFWQRNIFGIKFGSFCIIQTRFDHNWIKNGHKIRFYFWALFANLNFLNFIACAIVQCLSTIADKFTLFWFSSIYCLTLDHGV